MNQAQGQSAVNRLKEELRQVRSASLEASRNGDYMKVAKLTSQAARINRAILDAEDGIVSPRGKA